MDAVGPDYDRELGPARRIGQTLSKGIQEIIASTPPDDRPDAPLAILNGFSTSTNYNTPPEFIDADWEEVQSAVRAGIPIMIGDGEPVMCLTITAPGGEGRAEVWLGAGQHIEIDSNVSG